MKLTSVEDRGSHPRAFSKMEFISEVKDRKDNCDCDFEIGLGRPITEFLEDKFERTR